MKSCIRSQGSLKFTGNFVSLPFSTGSRILSYVKLTFIRLVKSYLVPSIVPLWKEEQAFVFAFLKTGFLLFRLVWPLSISRNTGNGYRLQSQTRADTTDTNQTNFAGVSFFLWGPTFPPPFQWWKNGVFLLAAASFESVGWGGGLFPFSYSVQDCRLDYRRMFKRTAEIEPNNQGGARERLIWSGARRRDACPRACLPGLARAWLRTRLTSRAPDFALAKRQLLYALSTLLWVFSSFLHLFPCVSLQNNSS